MMTHVEMLRLARHIEWSGRQYYPEACKRAEVGSGARLGQLHVHQDEDGNWAIFRESRHRVVWHVKLPTYQLFRDRTDKQFLAFDRASFERTGIHARHSRKDWGDYK